jgi:hypothetical protein
MRFFKFIQTAVDKGVAWGTAFAWIVGTGIISAAFKSITAIAQYGWGAVFVAALAVVCVIALLFSAVVASLAAWNRSKTEPSQRADADHPQMRKEELLAAPSGAVAAPKADASPVEDSSPQPPALGPPSSPDERQIYNELIAFTVDTLEPACSTAIDLQRAVVKAICGQEPIVNLALLGIRQHESTKVFFGGSGKLSRWHKGKPRPTYFVVFSN